jgi:hypothetical protein
LAFILPRRFVDAEGIAYIVEKPLSHIIPPIGHHTAQHRLQIRPVVDRDAVPNDMQRRHIHAIITCHGVKSSFQITMSASLPQRDCLAISRADNARRRQRRHADRLDERMLPR